MNKYKLSVISLLLSLSCAPSFASSFFCNGTVKTGVIKNINMFTNKDGKIQMGVQIDDDRNLFMSIDASNSAMTPMLRFATESKLLGRKLNFCTKFDGVTSITGMEVSQ